MTRRRLLGICGGVLRVRDALVNADFNCDPDPRSTSDEAEFLPVIILQKPINQIIIHL